MIDNRLNGLNPLAYLGVNAPVPPQIVVNSRDPRENDRKGYDIGAIWVVKDKDRVFMLALLENRRAEWVLVYPGSGGAELFEADSGIAVPNSSDEIQILGGTNINTAGAGSTVTINLNNNLSIASSLTIDSLAAGVVQTDSSGEFFADTGTDGQVFIGGGTEPNWANITPGDASITITNGPNSIDLTRTGASDADFTTGSGTAVTVNHTINFFGASNIATSASGNTITVTLSDNVTISGALTVTNDIIDAGDITVGGDVTLTSFNDGVVQIDNAGIVFADEGTDGQILIGSSSGAPAWANITSGDASVTITNGANSINLEDATGGGIPVGSEGFAAVQPVDYTPLLNDFYYLGSRAVLSEIFDDGNNFSVGDGVGTSAKYTAPSDGYYIFFYRNASIGWGIGATIIGSPTNVVYLERYSTSFSVLTSGRNFINQLTHYTPNVPSHQVQYTVSRPMSYQVNLDMGDTVEFIFRAPVNPGPAIIPLQYPTIQGQPSSAPITWICGWKITS